MKKILFFILLITSCEVMDTANMDILPEVETSTKAINYLALGDSYTIGQGVSSDESYPNQLATRLVADGILVDSDG